jgi:flagellar hook-associated protein 2
VTGLSGFDTESVVKSLMDAESIPLVKAQQSRQVLLWRQESYRDVTTQLRGFKSSYFDILNPTKNVLSSSNIKKLTATASSTDNVRVTANAGAAVGSHEVRVMQLATSAVARSGAGGATAEMTGTVADLNLEGKSFQMTLDGDTRTISLENYTVDNIAANLEAAIAEQFGVGKVDVSFADGKLTMDTTATGGASKITLSASADDGLTDLGFESGASNRISTSSTLASLAGKLSGELTFVDDTVSFDVNGKTFSFNATDTLKTVMDRVNADGDAGVTMRYNEVTDKLEVQAKKTGAGQTLVLQEAGGSSFFAAMGISIASGSYVENGDDAQIQINGSEIVTRSSNTFTVNDMSYTLLKTHETDEADTSISVGQDVTGSMDLIKEFVGKYNEVLDMINNKTSEKYSREFLPLTDAQREAMSEDQVEQWEGKAKTGLLQNDSMLQGLAQKLRQALTDAVDGAGLTLRDIGISSTSYQERGKLTIDEDKLKTAMETKGDQVATLLNGQPEGVSSYSRTLSAEERSTRYDAVGLFQRVSDILDDHVSTLRDTNGKKGLLLEKAGITGDASVGLNDIQKELTGFDDRITTLLDRLADKEEAYYRRFTAMEQALQRMNDQSSWLASQLGGM